MSTAAALVPLGRAILRHTAKEAARRAATALPRSRGTWAGSYVAEKVRGGWRVANAPDTPCRLAVDGAGIDYAFGTELFFTDGGSIPKPVQGVKHLRLAPDSFPKTYFLHDWCYAHAAVLARKTGGDGPWLCLPVTRLEADTLLYCGLVAEGATALEARLVFRAVRMFGRRAWAKCRKKGGA
ncbi:MAG: DUF1353 domain-containing protein [Kiritimatiellae bacterium]|nr:DUF1353 domain-containing protein [Kiritimatiellia bacterium]